MGVRATHRYNEKLIVYGDFLKADASDASDASEDSEDSIDAKGDGYGAGAIYFLPGRMEGYDVAVRGSYHTQQLDGKGRVPVTIVDELGNTAQGSATADVANDSTFWSLELLFSPLEHIHENGLMWYGGVGVTKIDSKTNTTVGREILNSRSGSVSDTELTVSTGLVLPTSFVNAFAAVEYLDGATYAAGLRYNF